MMIDSLTKLGRSAPKLILLALVQTFQHLLEESVLLLVRKQPIIGLLLNAVVKVNFIEKTSSNKRSSTQGMIKVITNSFIKIYCEKMSRAHKGKKYFTRCFTKKKLQITRVYSIFPITFAIAPC